jgi:Fur family transcriptional regulator, ferric uptake regulator
MRDTGQVTTSTDTSVEVLTTELRRRGERVTTARLAVAEVLAGTEEHLSAEQIALRAEELRPGIHRATVYRALDALGELGLVMHVHLGKAGTTYHLAGELAQEHQEHLHVRCTECGAVLDVDGKTLDPVRRKLQRDLGFRLDPEHVALLGICQDCSAS